MRIELLICFFGRSTWSLLWDSPCRPGRYWGVTVVSNSRHHCQSSLQDLCLYCLTRAGCGDWSLVCQKIWCHHFWYVALPPSEFVPASSCQYSIRVCPSPSPLTSLGCICLNFEAWSGFFCFVCLFCLHFYLHSKWKETVKWMQVDSPTCLAHAYRIIAQSISANRLSIVVAFKVRSIFLLLTWHAVHILVYQSKIRASHKQFACLN